MNSIFKATGRLFKLIQLFVFCLVELLQFSESWFVQQQVCGFCRQLIKLKSSGLLTYTPSVCCRGAGAQADREQDFSLFCMFENRKNNRQLTKTELKLNATLDKT